MQVESTNDILLTEKAVAEIKKIIAENEIPETYGLRLGVKGGGCSGFSYVLEFEGEPKEADTILEQDGIKMFVDGKSLFYLTGTSLDYSSGLNGKGFIFNNPNAKKTCGCGDSFSV